MSLNFTTFITNPTDLDNVLNNNSSQNFAAMTTYLNNAIDYLKVHKIKSLTFPSGTYCFNETNIDFLDDCEFLGNGAVIRDNNLSGTSSIWNFTNCRNIKISGFYFLGRFGSYLDFDFLKIGSNSSYIKIFNNRFGNGRRSYISVENLRGGASREGATIQDNVFLSLNNYNNNQQAAILLGVGGEYNIVSQNTFKSCPSAVRCINGANTIISENIILGMKSQGFDNERGLIYCESVGTNRGKIDVINNKINHNGSGITAIVMKGANTASAASKIIGNDILVHGSSANSNAIYLYRSPKTMILNNKLHGNSNANDSGIRIHESNGVMLNYNHINHYTNGIETISSNDVIFGTNSFDGVANEYINI